VNVKRRGTQSERVNGLTEVLIDAARSALAPPRPYSLVSGRCPIGCPERQVASAAVMDIWLTRAFVEKRGRQL